MASRGGYCPYCKEYSSIRKNGKQYVHKGNTRTLVKGTRLACRASGLTWEEAKEFRVRVDSGESAFLVKKEIEERG